MLDAEHLVPMKMKAWLDLTEKSTQGIHVTFVTDKSLESLEELLKNNLPEIGKKERRIMGEPTLEGISNISGGGESGPWTVGMRIMCKCRERDQAAVKNFINREIYLLCERENIEMKI